MKKARVILFLVISVLVMLKSYAQTETDTIKNDKNSSLKKRSFISNIDLLFIFSQKEKDKFADLKFINGAQLNYRVNSSESQLFFRQTLNRLPSGYLYTNNYVNLSFDFHRYQPPSGKRSILRAFYPQPVFIFQNNSGRGIQKRFQTGLFLYPVRYFQPNLKIYFGLGCFYDWSSWEVNNMDRINASPPELREKILFINSHTKLRKDMYLDNAGFRPTSFLFFNYVLNDNLKFNGFVSYQQSVVSPYNEEIKSAYSELRKVYPYLFLQFDASVKVFKGLFLKTSYVYDYERNNLSLYNSSWEYNLLLGVSWAFSSDF